MMYGNKLAAAIKVNGKVLREFKDTVYIPFGSEYTILIKNLNTTRAVVNVFIDGDNAVPNGLVLNAGQEIELERSIVNGNLTEGNRFKFIERTGAVEAHRGVKLEDGLIRIEHQFEIPPVSTWNNQPIWRVQDMYGNNSVLRGVSLNATNISGSMCSTTGVVASASASYSADTTDTVVQSYYNDAGITVPGSKSTQSFQTTTVGAMESAKHNMVIKLLGAVEGHQPVVKPVTVKHKPKCVTCGKQNKATAKFCTECGTALEIFA